MADVAHIVSDVRAGPERHSAALRCADELDAGGPASHSPPADEDDERQAHPREDEQNAKWTFL